MDFTHKIKVRALLRLTTNKQSCLHSSNSLWLQSPHYKPSRSKKSNLEIQVLIVLLDRATYPLNRVKHQNTAFAWSLSLCPQFLVSHFWHMRSFANSSHSLHCQVLKHLLIMDDLVFDSTVIWYTRDYIILTFVFIFRLIQL